MPHIFCWPPGVQGEVMSGMQGMGVSTPIAAAVADATVGFDIDWHMPKGGMFATGAKSMIVALGRLFIMGLAGDITISDDGAIPNEHCSIAPMQTYLAILGVRG